MDFGRLRPPNFPTIRLSQLAQLYHQHPRPFSLLSKRSHLKIWTGFVQLVFLNIGKPIILLKKNPPRVPSVCPNLFLTYWWSIRWYHCALPMLKFRRDLLVKNSFGGLDRCLLKKIGSLKGFQIWDSPSNPLWTRNPFCNLKKIIAIKKSACIARLDFISSTISPKFMMWVV